MDRSVPGLSGPVRRETVEVTDPVAGGLVTLGSLLIAGLAVDALGRRTKLPRVSLLVALGVLAGPIGLDLISEGVRAWFPVVAVVALVMVGFLIGGQFSIARVREDGRPVVIITLVQAVITALVVTVGLLALGTDVGIAFALGGIAVATDPAAILGVTTESGAGGPFARRVLGVVALDDVVGVFLFSLMLAVGATLTGGGGSAGELLAASGDVVGGVLLGGLLGLPVAYLSGRIRPGTPTLEEALGAVLLCGGMAMWLDVSFLLAAVSMGLVVTNLASHHERTFREIENIEWPFLIVFFVIAGASIDTSALAVIGATGVGYVVLRLGGKALGGYAGARAIKADSNTRKWLGMALLPQAGVALGMALVAAERFPDHGEVILTVAVAGTLAFELMGPLVLGVALRRVGEARR